MSILNPKPLGLKSLPERQTPLRAGCVLMARYRGSLWARCPFDSLVRRHLLIADFIGMTAACVRGSQMRSTADYNLLLQTQLAQKKMIVGRFGHVTPNIRGSLAGDSLVRAVHRHGAQRHQGCQSPAHQGTPTPCTLHPKPCTLHPTPCILYPTP